MVVILIVGYFALPWLRGPHKHEKPNQDHAEPAHKQSPSAKASEEPEGDTLLVSPQAEKNINLTTVPATLDDFQRTVTIPGRLVEQEGHSRLEVSAPLTGIVEKIFTIRGEAVRPGQPLFQLKLNHEETIERQRELLKSVKELEVEKQELKRLEKVTASGAVAGKRFLNTQYNIQKLKATIQAEKEGLLLLGFTQDQVDKILSHKHLVQTTTVKAPQVKNQHATCECEHMLQVSQIDISVGQQVESGNTLSTLTDYCLLLIEGQALEQDVTALNNVIKKKLPLTAIVEEQDKSIKIPNLQILFLDPKVDMETRALRFYVYLPNEIINQTKTQEGRLFVEWKFRPGQRVDLLVPIESWSNCIALPRKAVIQDGIESVVFVKQGQKVTRKPIVEKYRDARVVVIDNDGTLFPGEEVVVNGAYQLFLKMKNRSKPIDPHAGHHH
jgi:multidrug efflux pump subunit AcrA (membrane-fusion protein)